jgi:tRNA nucleotidyltransferase (CCA-adding enzyme)
MKFPLELGTIAMHLRQFGGDAYVVGGAVRDSLLGAEVKDWDVEVFGMNVEKMRKILEAHGKVDSVGASFGILKLKTKSNEYDFSVPRRENRVGKGHADFEVEFCPNMTVKQAAARRDFTINAMSFDLAARKLIDPFNGADDLEMRVLRHVGDKFVEDPLRVLRGMQFAGRFGLTVASETAKLCASLTGQYYSIAKERVWEEWHKWAVKSSRPSLGLRFLRDAFWHLHYPQVSVLAGISQDPQWHPEGNVWEHTLHAVDEAVRVANREGLRGYDRAMLVFAALLHDCGKATTTVLDKPSGRIKSPGHDVAGVKPAQAFLESIDCPTSIIKKVKPLVRNHLSHLQCETPRAVRRLSRNLEPATFRELAWVIECDHSARPPLIGGLPRKAKVMLNLAYELAVMEAKPSKLLTGKLLLENELVPAGPAMGEVLAQAYEAQLDGHFTTSEEAVTWAKELLSSKS